MLRFVVTTYAFAILIGCLTLNAAPAAADVVGYWRFEDGGFTADSSGNGHALSVGGSLSAYALPATGDGSDFPTVVPQTGQSNQQAAEFGGSGNFIVSDHADFNVGSTFTIEAYFNYSTISATSSDMIASQWESSGNQRAWFMSLDNATNNLRFAISANGSTAEAQNSGLVTEADKDYYAAVAFNAGSATFYLKNLTDGTPLQTATINYTATSIFNSDASFRIGAYSGASNRFSGIIDEVRWANEALSPQTLLATAVPEPASLTLLVPMTAALWPKRRRSH
ncbi:LamG domain-containing protein [Planctomycetales bacterium ZRK34]|nr:LamG domain-containing protein [Planctomycetales bacterium ZRK34]